MPLFIYLIQGFKSVTSLSERIILSMSISFIALLFTCYPIDLILNYYRKASYWDIVLFIQWIVILLIVYLVKVEFELKAARGGK